MNYQRRSPAMVLVLSFITCGLYFFYWIYQTSDSLRAFNRTDSLTPALELLISILCPPYIIYWYYKYGRIIFEAQTELGMQYPEDNSILYLVLSLIGVGIVGTVIMQASLNKMWDYYESSK